MFIVESATNRKIRTSQYDTTPPMDIPPLVTASGVYLPHKIGTPSTNIGTHQQETLTPYHQESLENHGFFEDLKETLVDVKDKITRNTPEKKAIRYSKKCVKELKKENKYAEEAEEFAEKGAKKADKYAHKAEKYLEKKEKASEKATMYHEKADENAKIVRECREAHISHDVELLHDAACRLQQAH